MVSLTEHLPEGDPRRELFDQFRDRVEREVGRSEVIALPCCVHLFGTHDYLAVLPRKGRIELRFSLDRGLDHPRITRSVPTGRSSWKHCLDIATSADIDDAVMGWVREAYHRHDD